MLLAAQTNWLARLELLVNPGKGINEPSFPRQIPLDNLVHSLLSKRVKVAAVHSTDG
jgi:hypothetical protein